MLYLDRLDFERRLAVEKDLDKQWEYASRGHEQLQSVVPSLGFDESDTFLYFSSLMGIKIVNVLTGTTVRVVGKVESTERFMQVALYQGMPQKSGATVGTGGKSAQEKERDPTFVCSAYKKNRFYLFTQREPAEIEEQTQRIA